MVSRLIQSFLLECPLLPFSLPKFQPLLETQPKFHQMKYKKIGDNGEAGLKAEIHPNQLSGCAVLLNPWETTNTSIYFLAHQSCLPSSSSWEVPSSLHLPITTAPPL